MQWKLQELDPQSLEGRGVSHAAEDSCSWGANGDAQQSKRKISNRLTLSKKTSTDDPLRPASHLPVCPRIFLASNTLHEYALSKGNGAARAFPEDGI
jgi:hypothetical protein